MKQNMKLSILKPPDHTYIYTQERKTSVHKFSHAFVSCHWFKKKDAKLKSIHTCIHQQKLYLSELC